MQLPPGLANLPKTLSALPVNLSKQTLLAMGLDSPSAARQDQMRVGSLALHADDTCDGRTHPACFDASCVLAAEHMHACSLPQ